MSDPNTLEYRPADPRTSWWAVISLCISIFSALGCFLIVPPFAAWLFALAVSSQLNKRTNVQGQGLALAAVRVSGWAIPVGLVVIVLMPSLGTGCRSSNRSLCASNLRGTAQSMNVYAADNSDAYPIVSSIGGYALAAGGSGTPFADPDPTMHSMYTSPSPSVTQNMWLLVLTGQVAPKQFICKSDPGPQTSASTTLGNLYQTNFNDGNGKPSDFAYSYSFAYPWETTPRAPIGPWWKNQTDDTLPLMADMAPFVGTGTPAATPADPTSKNANSFNHEREGQNVGYGDAHAEFTRNPAAGQKDDNIYTHNASTPSRTGMPHNGTAPTVGNGGKPGAYDICLVPAADGTTSIRH